MRDGNSLIGSDSEMDAGVGEHHEVCDLCGGLGWIFTLKGMDECGGTCANDCHKCPATEPCPECAK